MQKANYQITLVCENCDTAAIYEPMMGMYHDGIDCNICGCPGMRKPTNTEEILFDKARNALSQFRLVKDENQRLKEQNMEMRKRYEKKTIEEAGTVSDDPESERYMPPKKKKKKKD